MSSKFYIEDYPNITGIHPACEACPPTNDEEYATLRDSIRERGLLEPIALTPDGQLLDGRHRLRACAETRTEPRFTTIKLEPWAYVYDKHAARRNWSVGQRTAFQMEFDEFNKAQAKERQIRKPQSVRSNSSEQKQDSANQSAKQAGVGITSIKMGRKIKQAAPDLLPKLKSGELTLNEAHREARKREESFRLVPADRPIKAASDVAEIVGLNGAATQIKAPKAPKFNRTNSNVDWAWWTWNPVTGCQHGCNFCYAREIALKEDMKPYYPFGFEPAFHEYRLDAPTNTSVPAEAETDDRAGRVFVCSMADLFGKWVPTEWIRSVFNACVQAPQWEYLFLTKWPARYAQMPLLERAWYGASVIQQSDVKRVETAMQKFDAGECVKWISLEPMLEPIEFSNLEWCDLVVIGSQTSTTQPDGFVPEFAPEFDWVVNVVNQCREADVPYYLKANLGRESPGMNLPKGLPRKAVRA